MLLRFTYLFFIVLTQFFNPSNSFFNNFGLTFQNVTNDLHGVIYQYFGETHSEKNLPICMKNGVCSVVYERYWLRPIITRLCRCASGFDCPFQVERDNHTMSLNNRSSLKFCEPIVNELDPCKDNQVGITIQTHKKKDKYYNRPPRTVASCYCSDLHYWKHSRRLEQSFGTNETIKTVDYFKCNPLKKCDTNQFCGNVRPDYHSIYYVCSCPENHLCIYKDRNITSTISELFYRGDGFRAHCYTKGLNGYS